MSTSDKSNVSDVLFECDFDKQCGVWPTQTHPFKWRATNKTTDTHWTGPNRDHTTGQGNSERDACITRQSYFLDRSLMIG